MNIPINEIPESGLEVEFREPASAFPALRELAVSGEYGFPERVRLRLKAMETSGMIQVSGRVETRVTLACSRCLKSCGQPVSKRLELTFVRELPEVYDADTRELADLSAEEMGLVQVAGDDIDLTEAVQEQVVMALPMRILCNDACKGLCPQCGRDLNAGDCGCISEDPDHPFAGLKKLRL